MISEDSIASFNTRLTVDYTNFSKLTTTDKDKIRHYGSQAEALLTNKTLAMFVHHYKFELADALGNIRGFTEQDNAERVALSHQLAGIDSFVNSLKKAVYLKNKLGNDNIAQE
jgi:hypothetical protein